MTMQNKLIYSSMLRTYATDGRKEVASNKDADHDALTKLLADGWLVKSITPFTGEKSGPAISYILLEKDIIG